MSTPYDAQLKRIFKTGGDPDHVFSNASDLYTNENAGSGNNYVEKTGLSLNVPKGSKVMNIINGAFFNTAAFGQNFEIRIDVGLSNGTTSTHNFTTFVNLVNSHHPFYIIFLIPATTFATALNITSAKLTINRALDSSSTDVGINVDDFFTHSVVIAP